MRRSERAQELVALPFLGAAVDAPAAHAQATAQVERDRLGHVGDGLAEIGLMRDRRDQPVGALEEVAELGADSGLLWAPSCSRAASHCTSMPAITAVWKQASEPPTIARRPSSATSDLRSGASAPMPPIGDRDRSEVGEAAQRVGGDHLRALAELSGVDHLAHSEVADHLGGRGLDADQRADIGRTPPTRRRAPRPADGTPSRGWPRW